MITEMIPWVRMSRRMKDGLSMLTPSARQRVLRAWKQAFAHPENVEVYWEHTSTFELTIQAFLQDDILFVLGSCGSKLRLMSIQIFRRSGNRTLH